APDAVEGESRENDLVGVPLEPADRLVDPAQNLLRREAVEDVVADVGDECARRHARRRVEMRPQARFEDGSEAAREELARRAVGASVAERRDDLDAGSPGRGGGGYDGVEPAREIARTERDDAVTRRDSSALPS